MKKEKPSKTVMRVDYSGSDEEPPKVERPSAKSKYTKDPIDSSGFTSLVS